MYNLFFIIADKVAHGSANMLTKENRKKRKLDNTPNKVKKKKLEVAKNESSDDFEEEINALDVENELEKKRKYSISLLFQNNIFNN